jgi:uracil-DNA glycosylase
MNGKTEWNEKAKAWICYCVHPASVLHNQDNREYFENGIKNFAEKVKLFRK